MIGQRLCYQCPEFGRMIELFKVAQLVHDDIVGHFRRQEHYFVIKVKISAARAAPPPRLVIFDKEFANGKIIKRVEMRETVARQSSSIFAQFQILLSISPHQHHNTIHAARIKPEVSRMKKLERAGDTAQTLLLLGACFEVAVAADADEDHGFVGPLDPLTVLLKRLTDLAHLRVFLDWFLWLLYFPVLFGHKPIIAKKLPFVKECRKWVIKLMQRMEEQEKVAEDVV